MISVKEKLLSIIIPIYNSEKYLSECLDSIISSNSSDIEIILINDGSTDSSLSICEMYRKKDSRIKLYSQENSGVSIARNNGITYSNSKYVMFVDSDDVLCNNWDSILTKISTKDFYYFTKTLDDNLSRKQLLTYVIGNNDENICFAGPFSKIFRKDFLIENNVSFYSDLINGEDMLFNVACLTKSDKYKIINYSFYKYRNFTGSATKRFDEKIFKSDRLFQNKVKSELETSFLSSEEITSICDYCLQMAIYVLCQRISYIDNFKLAKKYFLKIHQSPYLDSISSKWLINKKYHFILFLYKNKFYYFIYYLFKLKLKISEKKDSGYYFTNI